MSTLVSDSLKIEPTFASEVKAGLTKPGQKELQAKYFYDDLGSALFEAITLLPEYGLTRADARLLRTYSPEIVDRIASPVIVAELGSGTGQKTRFLLNALRSSQSWLRYCPIDVSKLALDRCALELSPVAEVEPICESYIPGLRQAAHQRRPSDRLLVLFLGSTIGNFPRSGAIDFLVELRQTLRPGDWLLLGADLVKPINQLLLAYNDPTGVTAAFNLNVLARANRELGANFNLRRFAHESSYDEQNQRVEMHLRSLTHQSVTIPGAGCRVEFGAGETIWTESSHKYQLQDLNDMASLTGFRTEAQWVDREWPFVETLWTAL